MSRKKRPEYKGILVRPIVLRIPPPPKPPGSTLLPATPEQKRKWKAEVDQANRKGLEEAMARYKAETNRRFTALLKHYGLLPSNEDPDDPNAVARMMYQLALGLAMDHVPGFAFKMVEAKPRGAPKLSPLLVAALWWDVEKLRREDRKLTIEAACKKLAQRPRRPHTPHGWQHYSAQRLRRLYPKSRSDPPVKLFKAWITDLGDRASPVIEELVSAVRRTMREKSPL